MLNMFKSVFVGIALVVPGLSGSMFAVVVGLYDKILHHINHFGREPKKSLAFLLPVVLGCAIGVFASARLVLFVCENYSFQSYSFFIGLVLGGLPLVIRKIRNKPVAFFNVMLAILCFLCVMVMARISANAAVGGNEYVAISRILGPPDIIAMVFAGFLSCFLMTFPGMSGSVVLILLSQYGSVYNAVSELGGLLAGLLTGHVPAMAALMNPGLVILCFAVGAGLGFFSGAKAAGFLLEKHEVSSYYGILGLLLGAAATLFMSGVAGELVSGFASGGIHAFLGLGIMVLLILAGWVCSAFLDDKPEPDYVNEDEYGFE